MKTKSTILSIIITVMIMSFTKVIAGPTDTTSYVYHKLPLLEVTGKIKRPALAQTNFYQVELIEGNQVIETITCDDKKDFTFYLQEDKYYAIKIYKKGYAPKLISLNTNYSKTTYSDWRYQLEFTAELITESEYAVLDPEAKEFPAAVIEYNHKKAIFNYSEEYTKNIKRAMYSFPNNLERLSSR